LAAIVVIPARFASTRFVAKILATETGRPLVQHVVDQARQARQVQDVIVATDDERIVSALRPFETTCVMTSVSHQSGTDRIAEVARGLGDDIDVIVNVQGDEPEIDPATIDALVARMQSSPTCDMATVVTPLAKNVSPDDPNVVKCVVGVTGRAIYFSRSPVPFHRDPTSVDNQTYYHHLGLYAYRKSFLLKFAEWTPTPLERTEKLEQLRALEHGASIEVVKVAHAATGIDTAEQYAAFVRRYKESYQQ